MLEAVGVPVVTTVLVAFVGVALFVALGLTRRQRRFTKAAGRAASKSDLPLRVADLDMPSTTGLDASSLGTMGAVEPTLNQLTDVQVLAGEFNRHRGEPRLVVLASPTCPECLAGTRAVADILAGRPGERVAVFVVWMRGLPDDSNADAQLARAQFGDRRVRHLWDHDNLIGQMVADQLGRPGLVAWDMYLGYPPGLAWLDSLPPAAAWVHQMGEEPWTDDSHRSSGEDFRARLSVVVKAVTG